MLRLRTYYPKMLYAPCMMYLKMLKYCLYQNYPQGFYM